MSERDNGGVIFPHWDFDGPSKPAAGGMTLRDIFAVATLQSILRMKENNFLPEDDAAWCYKVADAMLAERAK